MHMLTMSPPLVIYANQQELLPPLLCIAILYPQKFSSRINKNFVLERGQIILAIHTPGHTAGSMTFYWKNKLFTGDTLLINGCGRTDFQSGDIASLYNSITKKIFAYPDETIVCPGHDYHGNRLSTIGNEKQNNIRLAHKTLEEFKVVMDNLKLPKPKLIDKAIPANLELGLVCHAAELL